MKWLMMVDPKSEMFRQASCIMGLKEGKISTSQNGEKGRSRQREVSNPWHILLNPYRLSWWVKLFMQSVPNTLSKSTLSKMFSKSPSLMPVQVLSSQKTDTKQ